MFLKIKDFWVLDDILPRIYENGPKVRGHSGCAPCKTPRVSDSHSADINILSEVTMTGFIYLLVQVYLGPDLLISCSWCKSIKKLNLSIRN
jgi:hypothetical protein